VKIHCPQCGTVSDLDTQTLDDTGGIARCDRCGHVFDALQRPKDASPRGKAGADSAGPDPQQRTGRAATASGAPFGMPAGLPMPEPSSGAASDPLAPFRPRQDRGPRWGQWLLLVILTLTLLLQLAWINRAEWLGLPQARPLCEWIDCQPVQKRDPRAFAIIERRLQADPQLAQALRLHLRFRNRADFAQPLPLIQLSLLDNAGSVLARRTFEAAEHLFPAPAKNTLAQPQEVFTIELLLVDPGARASGFEINFL